MENEKPAPFEAYSGDGPHIFVSYAHDDKENVYAYANVQEFQGEYLV